MPRGFIHPLVHDYLTQIAYRDLVREASVAASLMMSLLEFIERRGISIVHSSWLDPNHVRPTQDFVSSVVGDWAREQGLSVERWSMLARPIDYLAMFGLAFARSDWMEPMPAAAVQHEAPPMASHGDPSYDPAPEPTQVPKMPIRSSPGMTPAKRVLSAADLRTLDDQRRTPKCRRTTVARANQEQTVRPQQSRERQHLKLQLGAFVDPTRGHTHKVPTSVLPNLERASRSIGREAEVVVLESRRALERFIGTVVAAAKVTPGLGFQGSVDSLQSAGILGEQECEALRRAYRYASQVIHEGPASHPNADGVYRSTLLAISKSAAFLERPTLVPARSVARSDSP